MPNGYYGKIKSKREYHRGTPEERYLARVVKGAREDDCWGWRGSRDSNGYARIGGEGKSVVLAHRLSWRIHNGVIPHGLFVLHECDNPVCSNPMHLFLGTANDNNRDMREKGRGARPPYHSGETHPRAKLSAKDVEEIRAAYCPRKTTKRQLAEKYSVSVSTVKAIVEYRNWK